MDTLKLLVILGSTRPNRFGEHPAKWIVEQAKKLPDVEVTFADLRDHPLPFFNQPISPSMVKDGNYGDEAVNAWSKIVAAADAYVMVSPEYNHSPSAVLKNALDVINVEWHDKSVGFVSYGSVGGARAIEHLRSIAIELQMAPVRTAVHIPGNVVFGTGWNADAEAAMQNAASGMLAQVVRWGRALKTVRSA